MLIIQCPYCGERPEIEFHHGGEAHIRRPLDPAALTDTQWADHLYYRINPKGLHAERSPDENDVHVQAFLAVKSFELGHVERNLRQRDGADGKSNFFELGRNLGRSEGEKE